MPIGREGMRAAPPYAAPEEPPSFSGLSAKTQTTWVAMPAWMARVAYWTICAAVEPAAFMWFSRRRLLIPR